MARIPFQPSGQVGVGTPKNPRASADAAAAPWRAVAQVGQQIAGMGEQLGAIQAKKADQNDSVLASKYENSYEAQKSEMANFKLLQEKSGEQVTAEQIAEINERYTEERAGYIEGMTATKQDKYGVDLEHRTGLIDQGSQNFFLTQEIKANSAEFQVNYDKLLRAGKFDEADALVEEANWMTEAEKIEVREIGRKSVHIAEWTAEVGYSQSIRQQFDNKEVGWLEATTQLAIRNKQVNDSPAFTQDEKSKITLRNNNASESIRKQAMGEADTIVSVAFDQAKKGNSIQSILDEQGPFIESVYPNRLRALESFENSRTMVEIQDDAVKKGEATDRALWRLNSDKADLSKRVSKQLGFWKTKFFDPKGAEQIEDLINDVLESDIPKEDKGMLAQLLVEKSQNRVSGSGEGLVQHKKVAGAYTSLTEAYSEASSSAGNPNYWNTFFDDFIEVQEYAREHSQPETDIFVSEKIKQVSDKANADITQAILGAKATGRKAEETFTPKAVSFEDVLNQVGL